MSGLSEMPFLAVPESRGFKPHQYFWIDNGFGWRIPAVNGLLRAQSNLPDAGVALCCGLRAGSKLSLGHEPVSKQCMLFKRKMQRIEYAPMVQSG